MKESKDQGHAVAVNRVMRTYSRARGRGFLDYQTEMMYLLESLCRMWEFSRKNNADIPDFETLCRASSRMAKEEL